MIWKAIYYLKIGPSNFMDFFKPGFRPALLIQEKARGKECGSRDHGPRNVQKWEKAKTNKGKRKTKSYELTISQPQSNFMVISQIAHAYLIIPCKEQACKLARTYNVTT